MPRLVEFESTEYEFPDDATDDEVFSTLESLSIRNSPEAKAMKAAPKGLPSMPRPQVPGLTVKDPTAPKPGSVEETYEAIGGGPDSLPAKITRPFTRTADWMIEGMESGPGRVASGYKTAASRDPKVTPDQRFQGMADMLGGTLDTARPLLPAMARSLPGALKEAPKLTTAEIALGTAGPPIVKQGMEALGAPEGASNLAAEATGVVPLTSLASRTLRKPLTSEPKLGQTEITKPKTQGPQPPIDTGLLPPEAPASSAVASATPDEAIAPELDLFEQIKASGVTSRQGIQRKFKLSNKEAKAYATRLVSESSSVAPPKGAQPKTSPAVTVTEKPKTSKVRPIKEVLSDETGALDVDKFLDLMGRAKNRLTAKDPLDAQIEARKNAGKVATGVHSGYTELVRETHPAWILQELVKGEEADMGIRASLGEGLEKYGVPLEKQPAVLLESMSGTQGKIALDLDMARDVLMPSRGDLKSALKYGIRERHIERASYPMTDDDGKVIPYKLPGGESLADNATAMSAYEAEVGPEGMAKTQEALKQFRTYYEYLFEKAFNGGLLTKDFYEKTPQYNTKYIPAKRLEFVLDELQNDKVIHIGSRATAAGEREFQKRMMGSDKEILDPMISLVRDTIRINRAIAGNNARKALAGLADLPAGKDFIIKVGSDGKPQGYKNAEGKFVRPGIPMGYEPVSYLDQGIKKQVLVPKDVAAIYSGMDEDSANMVTKMMGHFSNVLRAGVTTNPVFWTGNLARDYWTAVQTTGLDPVSWAQGMIASTFRDLPAGKTADFLDKYQMGPKLYKQYLGSGGSHSGVNELSTLPAMADTLLDPSWLKAAKMVWDPTSKSWTKKLLPGAGIMEYGGTTAELSARLAVFRNRLKKGDDAFGSGWISRNSTINFSIGGKALKSFYQVMPFLKGRTGASRTGLEAAAKNPGKTALNLGAQLGIPAATLYYANVMRYPQVWDAIDDDTKRNHLMLIYGDKQDEKGRFTEVISAPLDGIPAAFYGALIGGMEIVRGADVGGWARNGIQLFSDSLPVGFTRKGKFSENELLSAIMPPQISTLYTLGSKKDLHTGRDLERQPNVRRDAAPEDRYNLQAKKPMVAAAQGLSKVGVGLSPHVLENIPKTIAGHWGRTITEAMPSVSEPEKSWGEHAMEAPKRLLDATKFQPFTKPLPSKPTLDLEVETKVQTRGSRFQDYSREIERISKVAKSGGEYQDLTQVAIQDFAKKYPDRNPNLVAKEFLASQKRFMVAKQKNFTAQERSIYSAPAEVRAELIRDAFAQMKPASRASVWADWKRKGIISSSVSREYRLLMEQDRRKAAAPVQ